MPMRKLSTDQQILLIALVAAILLSIVAAVVSTSEQAESQVPSSYSSGLGGAKAPYLLLEEMHYRVERWTASPTELASVQEPATLVLAEPSLAASPEEKEALQSFLERGGRVLAAGDLAATMLGSSRARAGMPNFEWKIYPRVLPTALTRNAPKIAMAASSYWQSRNGEDMVHYSEGGEDVVVSYPAGKGEVVWWAGATPLTNNGIAEQDNLALFLNSVGAPGERRVLWDEYFHEGGHTVGDSIMSSPLKWALLQLAVLGMLVLFTYSRRHGPIFVPAPGARLSPLEFVDALAQLYHRAHATNVSLEVAYNRFRSQAAPRLGLPRNCTARQLASAYQERFGKQEPDLGATLARAESQIYDHTVKEPETIELVRRLHRLTMAMRPQQTRKAEKK
jgi:hypothetical protein